MTKREEYGISFHKKMIFAEFYPYADCASPENSDIVIHISNSGRHITIKQIASLQRALNGDRIQEDWGEVMGSQLDIFQKEVTVQVGYTNRRIPIQDFKQLLEEWLEFISA